MFEDALEVRDEPHVPFAHHRSDDRSSQSHRLREAQVEGPDEPGAARLELESARELLAGLGTTPDLRQVDALVTPAGPAPGGLSEREIEVLRLVAAGLTNRAIAAQLYLSERTVHRHISNIFGRIGVNSRAAAATYAVQHHLLA
ncbi:response regulator transcription factor [Agromyces sp. NPDC056523]|uniref:helix-turn-helix transcriptional regulator n=1 Tax=Agromyces sp. NPDC056523 TaxID=3345850 RepID=UPI00367245D6